MIGLINNGPGIGDKIQFAALPQIFFENIGEKVVDISNAWVYDYNPYVIRDKTIACDKILNLWDLSHKYIANNYLSSSERFFLNSEFNFFKINLRHPRLYKFEEIKIIPNRIVIHTEGKSEGGSINDDVIAHIEKKYSNFEIIQVGGKFDKKTNFVSYLGLNIWDTVEIIASASIFIGVNSGMMNIANCYPRVNKKIILNRNDLDTLSPLNKNTGWLDYNIQYFNQSLNDIGITNSYYKI
jgi:hypothetical protein